MRVKNSVLSLLAVSLALPLFTPSVSLAQEPSLATGVTTTVAVPTLYSTPTADVAAKCVARTQEYAVGLAKRQADADAKLAQARTEYDMRRGKLQDEAEKWLATRRAQADEYQTGLWSARDTRGYKSDQAKSAIEAYRAALLKAKTDRRTAVDAANKTLSGGLAGLVLTRRSAIDAALAARRTTVNATFAAWQTKCGLSSAERKEADKAFRASLLSARTTYRQAAEKAVLAFASSAKDLRSVRKAAVKAAETKYGSDVQAARTVLKAALQGLK